MPAPAQHIPVMARFAAKPRNKGNSGADTCHVQALRVLGKKFPLEIFRRKKRAGIAIRVEEGLGTWLRNRPMTHHIGKNKN